MFRRRTDQVYATLQQVQRRISQQTAGGDLANDVVMPRGSSLPGAQAALPGSITDPSAQPPPQQIQSPAPSDPLRFGAALGAPITSPMDPPTYNPPVRRPSLSLPWEVATVVFLVWLGSLVGVFFFGRHSGTKAAQIAAGPRAEAGMVSEATTTASKAAPRYLLMLTSVSKPTADHESRLRADADRLNRFAEQNRAHGYQPWFGLRRAPDGTLQLVFGKTDAGFGIDKAPFEALAEALDRAGYRGARWVDVE